MSAIENEVIEKFKQALAENKSVSTELATAVQTELTTKTGPNAERLAKIFRENSRSLAA